MVAFRRCQLLILVRRCQLAASLTFWPYATRIQLLNVPARDLDNANNNNNGDPICVKEAANSK